MAPLGVSCWVCMDVERVQGWPTSLDTAPFSVKCWTCSCAEGSRPGPPDGHSYSWLVYKLMGHVNGLLNVGGALGTLLFPSWSWLGRWGGRSSLFFLFSMWPSWIFNTSLLYTSALVQILKLKHLFYLFLLLLWGGGKLGISNQLSCWCPRDRLV